MNETELKEYLFQNDDEFRMLAEQHRELERQLEELIQKPYPDERDQLQETVIKKKKLVLKDQMLVRMARYREQHAAAR